MTIYKVTGMAFYFDSLEDLMEHVMQRSDVFISLLNYRLVIKKQDGMVIVLYRIKSDVEHKELK